MDKENPTEYGKERPRRKPSKVSDAAALYKVSPLIDGEGTMATTRLSSKNQITIPVAMCRMMDMRAGDEIELLVLGDTVHVQRLPRTPEEWASRFDAPEIKDPAWGNKEQIDEYIRGERDSWDKKYDWPRDS